MSPQIGVRSDGIMGWDWEEESEARRWARRAEIAVNQESRLANKSSPPSSRGEDSLK